MNARRKRRQSGHAVLEFAFLVMLIVIIAGGASNLSLAIWNWQMLSDATRDAALWGANSTYHATLQGGPTTSTGWNGPQSIEAVFTSLTPSLSNKNVTASNYCTCTPGGTEVPCTSSCSTASGMDQPMCYVRVVATTSFSTIFTLPGIPSTFSFSSTSVMPVN